MFCKKFSSDANNLLLLSMIFLFGFLMLRSAGIYPVVFADEWSYSSYSRLLPLSDAGVPSYLYLLLFRMTNSCGDAFLECARVLNNFFFVLSLPLIYAIAHRVCSNWQALLISLLAVAGPVNTYAIYFMPEAMYFFGFWLLTWVLLTQKKGSSQRFALLVGALLGMLSLVKVHAVFLLPSLACYEIYIEWRSNSKYWLKSGVGGAAIIICSFAGIKLVLGYLLAGPAGITLFGSLYGSQIGGMAQHKSVSLLIESGLQSLGGHVMALAVMFGLPLAVMFGNRWRRSYDELEVVECVKQDIIVYTSLVLVSMVTVVCYFTASVDGTGPYESLGRLHMRYYNFALPLFYLIAATQLKVTSGNRGIASIAAAVVFLAACFGLLHLVPNFMPSMVDSPELRGFTFDKDVYLLLSLIGLAITVFWAFDAPKAASSFLFVVLPLAILISNFYVTAEVRKRQLPDAYDEAGQFARHYLGSATSQLTVIAPNPAALLRTLFHIDNVKTQSIQLEAGSSIDVANLPANTNWLLLIGDYELPTLAGRGLSLGQYELVPTRKNYLVDMKQASWPSVLTHVRGLSIPEEWGTWSTGHEVLLEFTDKLPNEFRLSLVAQAFGPNDGQIFSMAIGGEKKFFRLTTKPQTVTFKLALSTNERVIKFGIPQPISPKSIGLNDDSRELGIGLREIRITSPN